MNNRKFVLVTSKKWGEQVYYNLVNNENEDWELITCKSKFTFKNLSIIKPAYVFIPHWSYIIPEEIYSNFNCIVFHMTDLPYGRGGSPLQNLILEGKKETKISAIKVNQGIDTGDIYLKENLLLHGTAEQIFNRSIPIITKMISKIIIKKLNPYKQSGIIKEFKRRKPEDGNIESLKSIEKIYDYIRMLDCEGYPKAFLESGNVKLEFYSANIEKDTIRAEVIIRIKEKC